ncbi:MAG: hypothetical protein DME69_08550 [Verrucomicrobia bacterium]|nr:MAG: hypothetical protein DME69_08550 [Verrucomicrobiota bacterium]
MKTSIAKCFLAIGLLLVATARPTSANLIVNGDFETGTFAGWTTTPAPVGSNFGVGPLPPAHDTSKKEKEAMRWNYLDLRFF